MVGRQRNRLSVREQKKSLFFSQKVLNKYDVGPLIHALQENDIQVDTIQTTPTFHRYRLSTTQEVCLLDLVADPVPPIEPPCLHEQGFYIDTPYEIFVNKLCALLSRSEARDLWDVMELSKQGMDLTKGLRQAVQKDAGFSPLTLAWLLESLPLSELKIDQTVYDELIQFHQNLIQTLDQLLKKFQKSFLKRLQMPCIKQKSFPKDLYPVEHYLKN